MLGSEMVGVGSLLIMGALPAGIMVGILLWAFGSRFPMALLIAIVSIPVLFGTGTYMITEGNHKKIMEQRAGYQPNSTPTPAGYVSKPYTPGTAN